MLKRFIHLVHDYFGSRSTYLMNWLSDVVSKRNINRALMINDCSFSHAFTKKFLSLLKKTSSRFNILYFIREERQRKLNEKGTILSLDILDMLIRRNVTTFGLKWGNLQTANCIIVIPYSMYLRHEVNSSGCFIVINVNRKYRSLTQENKILSKYNYIQHRINLSKEFRNYLILLNREQNEIIY